ncbi:SDR family NAD(P)-dependent oxidoreductase [Nocardia nova]|uniref:SDR family NAD(P)-dependent oxidoreductase n=2 Tax=Nocardia TaxID=1817 RepID=UPI0033DBAB4A
MQPTTLVDVLTTWESERSDTTAFRFLESGEVDGPVTELTFGDLGRRARAIAAALRERGAAGTRALLLFPPGLDFVAGFFGCLYGSVAAVPAPIPQSHDIDRVYRRLSRIVADADIRVVLTTAAVLPELVGAAEHFPGLSELEWLAIDDIDAAPTALDDIGVGPDGIAFVQYTSGSTSDPRGVVVRHANLLHNQQIIAETFGHTPDAVEHCGGNLFVSWLPVFHDMGLIGPVLQSVYMGAACVLMSPRHFLERPQRWLEAVARYGAHTSGAPNFGYELCLRRPPDDPLDLSRWRVAFNGAEPIRTDTLARFGDTFAAHGFRRDSPTPVYGLAEATLLVSGQQRRRPPTVAPRPDARADVVGVGTAPSGMSIVIADPAGATECADDEIGEIWVAGTSICDGYLGEPERSAGTFGAVLADGRGGFLRTGDLGFVRDGELFVTGRHKDLLIIDGVNHYPQDIELTAERAHPQVRAGCVAAFSIDREQGETAIVVAEVKTDDAEVLATIAAAVRGAVSREHRIRVGSVELIRPGTIPKTSSGKIQRQLCRNSYLADGLATFPSVAAREPSSGPDPVADRVASWLVRAVADAVGTAPERISPTCPLADHGLGSRELVELATALSAEIGRPVDTALLFEYPTIAQLAAALSGTGRREAQPVVTAHHDDPIAIVAAACRFPGGADDPGQLWRLLADGRSAISEVPAGRWGDHDRYLGEPGEPGKTYTLSGGFLSDITGFDADFFGVNPREAAAMDPQQRLLLELAWEALERTAGDPAAFAGTATGVFLGLFGTGYLDAVDTTQWNGYTATGVAGSVASGRIAYLLGLEGPAVTVDTACSSSLAAVHLAVRALRDHDCDVALAGGATLLVSPRLHIEFSQLAVLSRSGRCAPFGSEADGAVWSEGGGVIVLKRLADAQRAGDRVLAILRGSAMNQDGRSQGLQAPSVSAQEQVIRSALSAADLTPGDIDYVETHGTGTEIGDRIEATALARAFGSARRDHPLRIGSMKSNIGHTQAAAGVAGLLKTVLSLQHERLVPSLHSAHPRDDIEWTGLRIQQSDEPWPRGRRVRRAGVSSFGISGTNVHVILEEAPARTEPSRSSEPADIPWVLAAPTPSALAAQARRLRQHLRDSPGENSADVGATLARRHRDFRHRAVIIGADRESLLTGLDQLAAPDIPFGLSGNVIRGQSAPLGAPVLVFPGQGAHWPEMAVAMLADSPVFADHVRRCARILREFVDWSLLDVLEGSPDAPDLERTDVVQPVMLSVNTALSRVWASVGVRPAAVIGHSQGEIAAAYAAGALSLRDALELSVRRGTALAELDGSGGMASIALPASEVRELLSSWPGALEVAAVNSPTSVVVSGEISAVDGLLSWCEDHEIRARRIAVGYASHSAHVDRVRDRLDMTVRPAEATSVAFISSVTGSRLGTGELDGAYWLRNLRDTVRFDDAVRAAHEYGYRTFIEVGPHPILVAALTETLEELGGSVFVGATTSRSADGMPGFLASAARLDVSGGAVDWKRYFGSAGRPVDLPTYSFLRERHWLDPVRRHDDVSELGQAEAGHPVLRAVVSAPRSGEVILTGSLSATAQPWLRDHAVHDIALLPATAFVDLALRAGQEVDATAIGELVLREPLIVPETGRIQIQAVVGGGESGDRTIEIYARDDTGGLDGWRLHAHGVLAGAAAATVPDADLRWPPSGAAVDVETVYEHLADRGYRYGPAFRHLRAVGHGAGEVFAEVALPPERHREAAEFGIHPALLDACLHAAVLLEDTPRVVVPVAWTGCALHTRGATSLRVRVARTGADTVTVTAVDLAGNPVLTAESVLTRPFDTARLGAAGSLFGVEWQRVAPDPPSPTPPTRWHDLPDGPGLPAMVMVEADSGTTAEAVHTGVRTMLAILQSFLDRAETSDSRLAVITRDAVTPSGVGAVDLAGAAVWGLVRSAQAEHPGRIVLVDIPGTAAVSAEQVGAALAGDEPQIAIRDGVGHVPRLAALPAAPGPGPGEIAQGTVVVTGAPGALGSLIARHLVTAYGVERLLLISRRGAAAPGADHLRAELTAAGADVTLAACDLADGDAVAKLLGGVDISGVVHAAGVLDDATIEALDENSVEAVLRPKVDGALHLHHATAHLNPPLFVLFSSAAGILGSPGQANYAAANAFLDALAVHRRASGLSGQSLAWSVWEIGLPNSASGSAQDRLRRAGLPPIRAERGLALFDAALGSSEPVVVPLELDHDKLRVNPQRSAMFGNLVRQRSRPAAGPTDNTRRWASRVAGLSADAATQAVLSLIRAQVTDILGEGAATEFTPDRVFTDMGFDSLVAVQFRNRLRSEIGIPLTVTTVFDYPTPLDLARYLVGELTEAGVDESAPEDRRIRELLATIPIDSLRQAGLLDPIVALSGGARQPGTAPTPIDGLDIDALVDLALGVDADSELAELIPGEMNHGD